MKGFVRKIDKLGRVCLPIEFRRQEKLRTNDQVEMVVTDNGLLMRRYEGTDQTRAAIDRLKVAVIKDDRIFDRQKERLLEQMDMLEAQIKDAAGAEWSDKDDT